MVAQRVQYPEDKAGTAQPRVQAGHTQAAPAHLRAEAAVSRPGRQLPVCLGPQTPTSALAELRKKKQGDH